MTTWRDIKDFSLNERRVWQDVRRLPAEVRDRRWRRIKRLLLLAVVLLVAGLYLSHRYSPSRAVDFADIQEHFKYGSIGSDTGPPFDDEGNGLPLAVMRVLPRMFPKHLPEGGPRDYTAFGFIQEPDRAMPIGFSQRRSIIDLTSINCAACHVGAIRETPEAAPRIYLGMPSNTVDLESFFNFLFRCAEDPRFTPENVLEEIEKDQTILAPERFIYRRAVTEMRAGLLKRKGQLRTLLEGRPPFGPGRVETFSPYKLIQFAEHYPNGLPEAERVGTAKYPAIWNQRPREGLQLHWDGNNTSVRERNVSAAFGGGATRKHVDLPRIERIKEWLDDLPPPKYPFARTANSVTLARGEALYLRYCFRCHDFQGADIGRVVPLSEIGTDPARLESYTLKLQRLQLDYGDGYPWDWKQFRKTDGYTNAPLDGIWARAPYLHNGSVPTMWDLLTPAEKRTPEGGFYNGHSVYDAERLGYRTDVKEVGGRKSAWFDLKLRGNSNRGHTGERYGTSLSDDDKKALIEYLKTF